MTTSFKNSFFAWPVSCQLGIFLCIGVLLSSCGKTVKPTHIPADANVVVVLDFDKLSSKAAGWQEMLDYAFGTSSGGDSDMIDFIMHAGIDLGKSAYFFGKVEEATTFDYYALSFELNDPEQFQASLKQSDFQTEFQEEDGLKLALSSGMVIGWEGERALVLYSPEGEGNLTQKFKTLFRVDEEEGLDKVDKDFYALLKKNYDMAFWMNYDELSDLRQEFIDELGSVPAAIAELGGITKSFSSTVHFEKGKIVSQYSTRLDEAIWKRYKKMFKDEIDVKILKNLPVEKPAFLISSGLNNQGLRMVLDEAKMLESMKTFGRVFSIPPEEIFGLITGDMVFMLNDFRIENGMSPYYEFMFGMKIEDRPKLDKLLDKIDGLFIKQKGDHFEVKYNNQKFYMVEIDDLLYLSNSLALKDRLLQGKERLSVPLINSGKGHISVLHVDFEHIQKMIPIQLIPLPGVETYAEEWFPVFESFQGTTDRYKDNVAEGEMEISLKDKSRNALMVIVELIRKTSKTPNPV